VFHDLQLLLSRVAPRAQSTGGDACECRDSAGRRPGTNPIQVVYFLLHIVGRAGTELAEGAATDAESL